MPLDGKESFPNNHFFPRNAFQGLILPLEAVLPESRHLFISDVAGSILNVFTVQMLFLNYLSLGLWFFS